LIDVERNVALEANGKSTVGSGSYQNCPTACCGGRINCLINGGAVEGFPVAFRAKLFDVEEESRRCNLGRET
jgi:hypothetical protein